MAQPFCGYFLVPAEEVTGVDLFGSIVVSVKSSSI